MRRHLGRADETFRQGVNPDPSAGLELEPGHGPCSWDVTLPFAGLRRRSIAVPGAKRGVLLLDEASNLGHATLEHKELQVAQRKVSGRCCSFRFGWSRSHRVVV